MAAITLCTGGEAAGQWPNRPVTMVIPFAAGGPTDVLGRVIAQRLTDIFGATLIKASGVLAD